MTAPGARGPSASLAPYALATALSGAASLVSVVLLARLVPPAAYGVYATVLTVVGFGQLVGFFWLQTGVLRLHATAAADPDRAAALAGALRLGFAAAAVATAACWVVGVATAARGAAAAAWWGLPLLLLRAWVGIAQAEHRAAGRRRRFVVTEAIHGFGGAALAAAGAYLRPGSAAAPLAGLVAGALLAATAAPARLGGVRAPAGAPAGAGRAWPLVRELLAYGGPLSLASLAAMALASSDRLLVASLLGPAAAGVYAVAYGLADRALSLALSTVTLAAKPVVFREYEARGAEAARAALREVAAQLMALGFPAVIMLGGARALVADVLVGARLGPAVGALLPWLAVGALGAGLLTLHFTVPFQLARRPWRTLAVTVPAAAVNVVANLVLLPRFGVVAAAWTTLLGYAVALALVWPATRGAPRAPFPAADVARTLAACAPLAAWVRVAFPHTPAGLAAMAAGSAAVYGASAVLLDVAGLRCALRVALRGAPRRA